MLIDYDATIVLRDGVRIYADIYRPRVEEPVPVVLAWGPYGKHWRTNRMFPGADVDPAWISEFTPFEAPDPVYWTAHGYAVAVVDPRGLWNSEGDFSHNGPAERDDLYDTIEWLGAQPWSSGNVGMLGVSYLAGSQYQAAAAAPPSLKAISPWECFSDWYREFATHGGIPETGFRPRVSTNVSYGRGQTEDPALNMWAHPLDDWYYADKYGDLTDVHIPAYVVASWSDHGLHSRGTLNAFESIGSTDKWLEVHGRKKWAYFYAPESVERQRAFFDTHLRDIETGMRDWPRARWEIRDSEDVGGWEWRSADALPHHAAPAALHLDFVSGRLAPSPPSGESSITIDPLHESFDLEYEFDADTEIVGPACLTLWMSADSSSDADIFAIVRKFDANGDEVRFPINSVFSDGPVAMGWLRASHRETTSQSTTLVPHHPHTRETPLEAGVPERLDIEIWASGTVFHSGEKLVITIQGRDFIKRPPRNLVPPMQILHESTRNKGTWTVHSGPTRDSVLRVPVTLG